MRLFRTFTGLILGSFLLSSVGTVSARTYITAHHTSTDVTSYVQNRNLMNDNGSFGDADLVNRAEFAKIVSSIHGSNVSTNGVSVLPFRDVPQNSWYAPYIASVYQNGYMTGYTNNTFRPNNSVTFAEAAKVLSLAYNLDISTGGRFWYTPYIQALSDANAIPLSILTADQALTRREISDMLYRLDSGDGTESSRSYQDFSDQSYTTNSYTNHYNNNYNNNNNTANCRNEKVIAVSIDPNQSSVSAGDTFSYDIDVANCSGSDQRVDVIATLDNQVTFDSASDRGYTNGQNRVDWDSIPLASGQTKTITLSVQVKSLVSRNDQIGLTIRAIDGDRDSDTNSVSVSVSRSNTNSCYYDSNNRYICNTNSNNCYYDSSNRYICNNNGDGNCYYDSNNRYICNNNSTNNGSCYYDSNNNYICNNNNTSNNTSNNNCYYDSHNNYICNNGNGSSNNNCYYNSNNQYICQ
jgi:hypothetical protein